MCAWALALSSAGQDEVRLRAGARLFASVCAQARAEAVALGTNVAVDFAGDDRDPEFRIVRDSNGNGVRRAEVDAGVDPVVRRFGHLGDHFREVRFEVNLACAGIDGADPAAVGSDPLRFGTSRLLVFTPSGTSSGGTGYLAGTPSALLAVRVLGATGRVRVLRCGAHSGTWGDP